jgi:predicted DNA-binding transcriptional regulator YafY
MQDFTDSQIYAVISRLIRLRDLLSNSPQSISDILQALADDYTNDEAGKRQLRRDVRNLEAQGYTLHRHQKPLRWSISDSPHLLSDDDIQALIYVRDSFPEQHPFTSTIQQLLNRLTSQLSKQQQLLWQQQAVFKVPLNPAIDYSHCVDLIRWLENAIAQRRQITFLYRSRKNIEGTLHERLDPYEIEYTDRHFYLNAFSYRYNSIISFRIDRIIQDKQRKSPELLPNKQQPRRSRPTITFRYRLAISFVDGGISERFTIISTTYQEDYVEITASDTSEFRIVRVLLGYGEHAILIDGPETLRQRLSESIQRMSENHQHLVG